MSNTKNHYGLLDRRTGRLISSYSGSDSTRNLDRACTVADSHELTGYLSVVRIDGWGEQLTGENLRPAWYAGRTSAKAAA